MSILIAYQYLSFKGGIEEVILNQSKLLKKDGHRVALLTSSYQNDEVSITPDNIPNSLIEKQIKHIHYPRF
jgi:hypothetical protein